MGSCGDKNGEIKPSDTNPNSDSFLTDTQPFDFDSRFSPSLFSGDKAYNEDFDDLHYLQSTVPFDDNKVLVEGELDTQVWEFGEETQVLNFGGETQVLEDLDCFINMETQLLDEVDREVALDSDGEGTDRTEVLDNGDEVSDAEVVSEDCNKLFSQEEKKEVLEQYNAPTDEKTSSGIDISTVTPDVKATPESKPGSARRFTSVRAASLRASGLAARNAALRKMNSESYSIRTDSQFSDQSSVNDLNPKVREKINQADDQGNHDNSIDLRYTTNCRVGSSIARELFAGDCFSKNQGLSCSSDNADAREDYDNVNEREDCDNVNGREDLHEFPDGPLAGLSYVDSQEPGELSQANALNLVEKLVNDNLMELDDELDLGKSTGGKSKLVLCAKGALGLAKKTIEKNTAGEAMIFDWNDNLEDEGGGDIYSRRKEEFYGNKSHMRKSRTLPLKPKGRKLDEFGNEDQLDAEKKVVHSDSKLSLCKSKDNDQTVREDQMNSRRNLFNEFDEQLNSDSARGHLETNSAETGAPEVPTVGFDTQMAAEAMEALFYGDEATEQNANHCVQNISKGSSKGSFRGKSRKRVSSKEPKLEKSICCSVAAPVTRSKRTKPTKEFPVFQKKSSKNIRQECYTELLLPKVKKAKSINEHQNAGGIDMYKTPSKSIKQRKVGGALERIRLHGTGRSTKDNSVNEGHPEEIQTITPVARRTRQSLVRRRRSFQKMSVDVVESDNLEAQSKTYVLPEDNAKSVAASKRSRRNNRSTCIPSITRRITRSSLITSSFLNFVDQNSEGNLSHKSSDKQGSGDDAFACNSTEMKGTKISTGIIVPETEKVAKHSDGNQDAVSSPVAEGLAMDGPSDRTPKEKSKSPGSACTTPVNHLTPINAASPVCMDEEYYKRSCQKNLSKSSLVNELKSLSPIELEPISPLKDMRKRRDLASVKVLFSNHLDDDIIKQQKKILARLPISEASSILDATHFITDKFVRTRNMLEAMASGKPVVSHLWLESIAQVNIHIDEEAYILRDIKKEKELGFCMPVSLAHARKRPLLQGRRVFVTPNTKPGKETISHLVTAVHGQAVERIGRSAMKDDKVPDDLLVLSCEEDYAICVPFLEKGAAVYSSELLLNGIVTQKLDYERHRLFSDHVRRTRSTIWVKKNNKFIPVTKEK